LELGKKPPRAAVAVAVNGRGLGETMRRWNGRGLRRDDAKMEWQERQSL